MRLTLRVDKKMYRKGSGASDEERYRTRMVCVEEKLLLSELLYKVSE